ncbi:hypothetical protein JV173_01850 [Acholeplasma equirhinis]|uniref:hypothetical protein n=1 Tax=Acholeplasma equirhinis TaxID=555393 RepID=UPI00197AF160|nr:hypothetical protein [Acholeplasma equirhinis]MBN3490248.1 hypothetical protein [Acholeplasma equirhinis]
MESVNEKETEELKNEKHAFESKKIISLNRFFMKHVLLGLMFSFLIFIVSIVLLIVIILVTNMDASVKITIISMVATFILTTSKTMIDRLIEVVVYIMRLLGEEQRGLNKKIGVDIEDVEFESLSEDVKEE